MSVGLVLDGEIVLSGPIHKIVVPCVVGKSKEGRSVVTNDTGLMIGNPKVSCTPFPWK